MGNYGVTMGLLWVDDGDDDDDDDFVKVKNFGYSYLAYFNCG
jgi:hypothetical protein